LSALQTLSLIGVLVLIGLWFVVMRLIEINETLKGISRNTAKIDEGFEYLKEIHKNVKVLRDQVPEKPKRPLI
jgi:hypothetical protein